MKMYLTSLLLLVLSTPAVSNDRLADRMHGLADRVANADLSATQRQSIRDQLQSIAAILNGGGSGGGGGAIHENCAIAKGIRLLAGTDSETEQLNQLESIICENPESPAGSIFYPNGSYAYVDGNFSDKGSWKYPNGKYAFVSGNYSDKGSWKYPNGNYAFVSGNYSDKGSWKYPNGKYAFVSGNYSDAGSFKYPNGNYAFVSGNYADKGSWKYPNGKFAFVSGNYSDRNRWYYPNGNKFKDDPTFEILDLITLVENHIGEAFFLNRRLMRNLDPKIKTILTISWVQVALEQ